MPCVSTGEDRDEHADRGDAIAHASRFGRTQIAQAKNEQHTGDEIGELTGLTATPAIIRSLLTTAARGLNISSMRSVTVKPPKTLSDARITENHADDRVERRVKSAGDENRADEDDAVNGVGGRHQRRVQRRRNLRDHFDSDEERQDEDRQFGEKGFAHGVPPDERTADEPGTESASRVGLWTISPLFTSVVPATISSLMSSATAPSLMM